jgi:hypothetical protein
MAADGLRKRSSLSFGPVKKPGVTGNETPGFAVSATIGEVTGEGQGFAPWVWKILAIIAYFSREISHGAVQ